MCAGWDWSGCQLNLTFGNIFHSSWRGNWKLIYHSIAEQEGFSGFGFVQFVTKKVYYNVPGSLYSSTFQLIPHGCKTAAPICNLSPYPPSGKPTPRSRSLVALCGCVRPSAGSGISFLHFHSISICLTEGTIVQGSKILSLTWIRNVATFYVNQRWSEHFLVRFPGECTSIVSGVVQQMMHNLVLAGFFELFAFCIFRFCCL